MTTKELYEIIKQQQEELDKLKENFTALKEWSDLNDYWLREMIDALTDSVGDNWDRFDNVFARLKKLENKVFSD